MVIYRVNCDGDNCGEFVNEIAASEFAQYLAERDPDANINIVDVEIDNPWDEDANHGKSAC